MNSQKKLLLKDLQNLDKKTDDCDLADEANTNDFSGQKRTTWFSAQVLRQDTTEECAGTLSISCFRIIFVPADDWLHHSSLDTWLSYIQSTHMGIDSQLFIEITVEDSTQEICFKGDPLKLEWICRWLKTFCDYALAPEDIDWWRQEVTNRIFPASPYSGRHKGLCRKHDEVIATKLLSPRKSESLEKSSILEVGVFKNLISRCPSHVAISPWRLVWSLKGRKCSMSTF